MTTEASLGKIEEYWTSTLGLEPGDLRRSGISVVRHGPRLDTYRGAYLLRRPVERGAALVISVPPGLVDYARAVVQRAAPDEVFTPRFLDSMFGPAIDRIMGAVWLAYADQSDLRPIETREARLLGERDEAALRRLALACDEDEWVQGGIMLDHPPVFGIYRGAELIAAATSEPRGLYLANVGVVTHPAYRGQGYGKAIVAAASRHGFTDGYIMQYQALHANTASIGIARALGYQEYGATLSVRLRHTESPL